MERVLEPELMDDPEQAAAYAASDFSGPHTKYVTLFGEIFPEINKDHEFTVADLACGPADPIIRFASMYPNAVITGYDDAEHMLALGREAVKQAKLSDRIILRRQRLPITFGATPLFDVVLCNGSMHHFPESVILWETVKNIGKPNAAVFVMDLIRPATTEEAKALVQEHSLPTDPELMKIDFYNSLLASFLPQKIRIDLNAAGLSHFHVEVVSDRHMMIYGRL